MASEFQTSVKQIADEVELEDVTQKLNEAGNIPMDDYNIKPDITDSQGIVDGVESDSEKINPVKSKSSETENIKTESKTSDTQG